MKLKRRQEENSKWWTIFTHVRAICFALFIYISINKIFGFQSYTNYLVETAISKMFLSNTSDNVSMINH
jgi:hypothetical protein